jgi:colanic acid/amylovoran biosynthesis protein
MLSPAIEEAGAPAAAVFHGRNGAKPKAPICCILGASFGTRNLGVSALAASTVAAILHSMPDARILLLDYGKTPLTNRVRHRAGVAEVELINLRFSWKLWLPNNIARLIAVAMLIRLAPSRAMRDRMIARNAFLKPIQDASLIASLAGGDSFSDIYGIRRLWYVTLPQLLVLALGKPLIILPQTLGPFKSWLARTVGGFIMRHARRVYSRDQASLDEVRPLLGSFQSKLDLSYDMAFALEPFPPANVPDWLVGRRDAPPLIGLNVSGLLYHGGYTRNNMFGLTTDYKLLIEKIIAYFIEQERAEVVLVPHVFAPASDLESDPAACAAIYAALKERHGNRLRMIPGEFDQHEIKYLIGKCDFVLGSRMHACIAALSQSVPAVGLAYSKKFSGVLATIGVEDLVADLRGASEVEILSRVSAAYSSREKIRADLARRMPAVRQKVLTLFARMEAEDQQGNG